MALPLMLLNLISTAYTLVDTFFVGQISELSVGAISLVAPIISCGDACIVGLCAAAIALVSRALGENDEEKASKATNQIFLMGIIFGVFAGILFLLFRDNILVWMETPSDIYADTKSYLTGISFDFLFFFIISFFQSIKQSGGDTKTGVVIMVPIAIKLLTNEGQGARLTNNLFISHILSCLYYFYLYTSIFGFIYIISIC